MRVQDLNVGVDTVSRLRVGEDVKLPSDGKLRPIFMPIAPELDEVLRRPSLNERLPSLLQPETVDADLLDPLALSQVREEVRNIISMRINFEEGERRRILEDAKNYLSDAMSLDDEVRRALAALLKG